MAPTRGDPQQEVDRPSAWGSDATFGNNIFVPIRLGLALVVIWSHSFPIARGTNATEPLYIVSGEYTFGDIAVNLFLATSGFLVTRSWERSQTTAQFFQKRVLRIYPAFIVLMIFQAFILAPLATPGAFAGYSARQIMLISIETIDLVGYGYPYGGLLPVFVNNPHPGEMNGSLWSVRYEFVCYLILAGAGAVLLRRRSFLAGSLLLISVVYTIGWLPPWHQALTALFGAVGYWPRLLSFFLAGVSFYRFRKSIPHNIKIASICAIAIGGVGFISPQLLRGVLPFAATYLLFWLAYHPLLVGWKIAAIGDYSYGTYLYGFPIQQAIILWVSPHIEIGVFSVAVLGSILSVTAGALSWYGVERRFLSLKPLPPIHPEDRSCGF